MQGRCLELEEETRWLREQGCREFATIKKKGQEELRKQSCRIFA